MLVHHHRHVRAGAAHRRQHRVERRGGGDVRQRACVARGHGRAGDDLAQQLLDVHAARDVIQIAGIDRVSRVGCVADDLLHGVDGRTGRDAGEADPGHHHLAGGEVAELEELAQDAPGLAAQQAALVALLDDELQLLAGVIALALVLRALDADQRQQPVARGVEDPYERQQRDLERLDDRRHEERGPQRRLQRQPLRHHLAHHDVDVGEHADGDAAGQGVTGKPAHGAERRERPGDVLRQHPLAVHPQAEAGNRDADLCSGDIPIEAPRVSQDPRHASGQASPLRRQMVDVGARGADDGELGGHEQPVGDGQGGDDRERHQELAHASAPSSSGGVSRVATTDSMARSATRSTRKE